MKRWQGTIYNEFRDLWIRWHDYVSIMVHNFPIVLIRRYDWLDTETSATGYKSTYTVIVLGVNFL